MDLEKLCDDFDEKFKYNGEPKTIENYERIDFDTAELIKLFIISAISETKKETIQECIDRVKKLKRMEPQDTGLGVDYICVGCANAKQDCKCEILNSAFNEAIDKLKEIKVL